MAVIAVIAAATEPACVDFIHSAFLLPSVLLTARNLLSPLLYLAPIRRHVAVLA